VAFQSQASNLVPSDTNGVVDIFVRDRIAGTTARVSVSSTGQQGNGESTVPSISANGRFVAFNSSASNLAPKTSVGCSSLFVHDRDADGDGSFDEPGNSETTTQVTVAGASFPSCNTPSLSADGRYIAFWTRSDLLPGGVPGAFDVYVHDMLTGTTTRASVSSTGMAGNGISTFPSGTHISADGRYVAFESTARNLVAGDTNTCGENTLPGSCPDIFVRDLLAGTTTRVSVSSSGAQGDDISDNPSISGDGRVVAFFSYAFLVPGVCCGTFVHDLISGTTTFASVTSEGFPIPGDGWNPAISADGRYVSLDSVGGAHPGVAPCDSNGLPDVVVHNMVTGATTLVSVANSGRQSSGGSGMSAISADGAVIAFVSAASNLDTTGPAGIQPTDTNGAVDIFVREGANQPHPLGPVSGAIYRTDAGPATPVLRTVDCNLLWPQGL
jgi:Tol biopolymer transport system component